MWSSDRRALCLSLAALAGCGFEPVFDDAAPSADLLGRIDIASVRGRIEFLFRESFERAAGVARDPRYLLSVDIQIDSADRAIAPDASITRFNLTATAGYALRQLRGNAAPFTGSVQSFTAYNATADPFPTRVAERDAERRLADDLARRILRELVIARETGAL